MICGLWALVKCYPKCPWEAGLSSCSFLHFRLDLSTLLWSGWTQMPGYPSYMFGKGARLRQGRRDCWAHGDPGGRDKHHCGICTQGLSPLGCSLLVVGILKWTHARETWDFFARWLCAQGLPEGFADTSLTACSPHAFTQLLSLPSVGVRIASWWCSPSFHSIFSYFFHSGISTNKIFACLFLSWYLFLRISRLNMGYLSASCMATREGQ